jgi:hypothetical protein
VQVPPSLLSLCELGDLSASQVMLLLVTSRAVSTAPRRHNEANGTPWHYNNSIQFNCYSFTSKLDSPKDNYKVRTR